MFSKPKVTKVAAAPIAAPTVPVVAGVAGVTVVAAPTVPVVAGVAFSATTLKSTNPDVQAFYNSLSTPQRIAHELAIEKLGTSYDVTRTHGFLRYLATK